MTGQVDQAWFDRAGNFHSDALYVVERYTPQPFPPQLRSHHRGPEGVYAAVENEYAPLSSSG